MWQEIIVYIIGGVVAAYIAIAVYRAVARRSDPCAKCTGCDLKKEFERKRRTCGCEPGREEI